MRWLVSVALLVGCSKSACDARALAASYAGADAVDCGAADPYAGRTDPRSYERSVACMVEALDAGRPFYALWLEDCQLDVCAYHGRAYDGATLHALEQRILGAAPSTGFVTVTTCAGEVAERRITTPGGEVLRREVVCAGAADEPFEVGSGECPEPHTDG